MPSGSEKDTSIGDSSEYVFGHSSSELERLSAQGRLLEPFTRRLFDDAGLRPGMRVLDVGCGHGDVTLLAADYVGPSGEVVGLDNAEAAVEATRARFAAMANVEIIRADLAGVTFERPFDLVVGRAVLGYLEDPVAALRALRGCVRAGGVVAFQEWDLDGVPSQAHAPLYYRSARLAAEALRRAGFRTELGLDLSSMFEQAGLPGPQLGADTPIGRADGHLFQVLAETIRSLLPAIERFGLATAAEVQVDTLAVRLRDEARGSGRPVLGQPLIRAYARMPAA